MKESWVLFDSFKKAERIQSKLLNNNPNPIFIIHPKGRILFANKSAQQIIDNANSFLMNDLLHTPSLLKPMSPNRLYLKKLSSIHKSNTTQQGIENFYNIVFDSYKDYVMRAITQALKGSTEIVEAPIRMHITNPQNERKDTEENSLQESTIRSNASQTQELEITKTQVQFERKNFGIDRNILNEGFEIFELKMEKSMYKMETGIMISLNNVMRSKIASHCISLHQLQSRKYIHKLKRNLDSLNMSLAKSQQKELSNAISLSTFILHSHEQTLYLTQYNLCEKLPVERESVDIYDYLFYMMECLSIKALENKNEISLQLDPSFPSDVNGEINKFRTVFVSIMNLILSNSARSEINIKINMKVNDKHDFELGFEIGCLANSYLSYEEIKEALSINDFSSFDTFNKNRHLIYKYGLGFLQCTKLIQFMKGTLEVSKNEKNIIFYFEIPFGHIEFSEVVKRTPKIDLTRTRIKLGEYCYKWSLKQAQEASGPNPHKRDEMEIVELQVKQARLTQRSNCGKTESTPEKNVLITKSFFIDPSIRLRDEEGNFLTLPDYSSRQLSENRMRLLSPAQSESNFFSPANSQPGSPIFYPLRPPKIYHKSKLSAQEVLHPETLKSQRRKFNVPKINLKDSLRSGKESGRLYRQSQLSKSRSRSNSKSVSKRKIEEKKQIYQEQIMHPNHQQKTTPKTSPKNQEENKIIPQNIIHETNDDKEMAYSSSQINQYKMSTPVRKRMSAIFQVKEFSSNNFSNKVRVETEAVTNSPRLGPDQFSSKMNDPIFIKLRQQIEEKKTKMLNEANAMEKMKERIMNSSKLQPQNRLNPNDLLNCKSVPPTGRIHFKSPTEVVIHHKSSRFKKSRKKKTDYHKEEENPIKFTSSHNSSIDLEVACELGEEDNEKIAENRIGEDEFIFLASRDRLQGSFGIDNLLHFEKKIKSGKVYPKSNINSPSEGKRAHFIKTSTIYENKKNISFFEDNSSFRLKHEFDSSNYSFTLDSTPLKYFERKKKFPELVLPEIHTIPTENELEKVVDECSKVVMENEKVSHEESKAVNSRKSRLDFISSTKLCVSNRKNSSAAELLGERRRRSFFTKEGSTSILDPEMALKRAHNKQIRIIKYQNFKTQMYQQQLKKVHKERVWEGRVCMKKLQHASSNLIGKPRVLVVDDSDYSLDIIKAMLKHLHYDYELAKNGVMAYDRFCHAAEENNHYSLILMDILMPTMDGFQATKKIREYEISKMFVPSYICGLSASLNEKTEAKSKKCGMNQILKKPITQSMLEKLVSSQVKATI